MDGYYIDRKFERTPGEDIGKAAYECCQFFSCDLAGQNLSGYQFIDCSFADCNLSLVSLNQTVLRDVQFRNCKMLGLHFEQCNQFGRAFAFEIAYSTSLHSMV